MLLDFIRPQYAQLVFAKLINDDSEFSLICQLDIFFKNYYVQEELKRQHGSVLFRYCSETQRRVEKYFSQPLTKLLNRYDCLQSYEVICNWKT